VASSTVQLTPALLGDPTIQALPASAKRLLVERLSYILEICDKIDAGDAKQGNREFINNVELDAWVNVGAPGELGDQAVSSWLMHASWTMDCQQPLALNLDAATRSRVSSAGEVGSWQEAAKWMAEQSAFLRSAVKTAAAATSLTPFVANMIAIDALLLNLLSTLTRARLSAWLLPSSP
jgi:hypothetical protein